MGRGGARYNAGRPAYRGKAEHCLRIDVRRMNRRGYLFGGGTLNFHVGDEPAGSISYSNGDGSLILSYALNGEARTQRVPSGTPAATSAAHGRGLVARTAPWRVAVLYLRRGGFYCRRCARVSYSSQSEDVIGRAWRKEAKIERRLGEDWERPKGMHWSTYERLIGELEGCGERREAGLCALLARLDPRLIL